MKIKIYSTPTCPYCVMAKNFFNSQKIQFEDIDVSLDKSKAEEVVKLSGQMGVPVIVIEKENLPGGKKVIIGFDRTEIDKTLKS